LVIREDGRRTDEDAVFQDGRFVHECVVLDLAVVAETYSSADVCTPSDYATFTESS
jgi:hypothetical protein